MDTSIKIIITILVLIILALLALCLYNCKINITMKIILCIIALISTVLYLVWIWSSKNNEPFHKEDKTDKADKESFHKEDKADKADKESVDNENEALSNKSILKWNNKDAASYLNEASKILGPPSSIDVNPDGMVVWKKRDTEGTCFSRHELRDESISHRKPLPHVDYFYSYIDYEVPLQKFDDIRRLSGSVGYDPLKKQIYARCANVGANIASLGLVTEIANGNINIKDIHANKIYKKWINESKSSLTNNSQYDLLCKNIRSQEKELPDDCFPLAFPDDCVKKT